MRYRAIEMTAVIILINNRFGLFLHKTLFSWRLVSRWCVGSAGDRVESVPVMP